MDLAFDRGGSGNRLLILLHGLGATRKVWQPMLENAPARWPGSWITPDLRGHGQSSFAKDYPPGLHAADVAELATAADVWSEIVVLGHSMGGVVALALASEWFGIRPLRVHGLGIKVSWSAAELSGLEKMSASPLRWFASRDEAVARYAKTAGLAGLVETDSPILASGVVEDERGWRLAADPAAASFGPPPMAALMRCAKTPIHLACGAVDRMVGVDQLRVFDERAVEIPGAGHNAMIESPGAVWDWLDRP